MYQVLTETADEFEHFFLSYVEQDDIFKDQNVEAEQLEEEETSECEQQTLTERWQRKGRGTRYASVIAELLTQTVLRSITLVMLYFSFSERLCFYFELIINSADFFLVAMITVPLLSKLILLIIPQNKIPLN